MSREQNIITCHWIFFHARKENRTQEAKRNLHLHFFKFEQQFSGENKMCWKCIVYFHDFWRSHVDSSQVRCSRVALEHMVFECVIFESSLSRKFVGMWLPRGSRRCVNWCKALAGWNSSLPYEMLSLAVPHSQGWPATARPAMVQMLRQTVRPIYILGQVKWANEQHTPFLFWWMCDMAERATLLLDSNSNCGRLHHVCRPYSFMDSTHFESAPSALVLVCVLCLFGHFIWPSTYWSGASQKPHSFAH